MPCCLQLCSGLLLQSAQAINSVCHPLIGINAWTEGPTSDLISLFARFCLRSTSLKTIITSQRYLVSLPNSKHVSFSILAYEVNDPYFKQAGVLILATWIEHVRNRMVSTMPRVFIYAQYPACTRNCGDGVCGMRPRASGSPL